MLKIEIYEKWPDGSTRTKVGIFIVQEKNKYVVIEAIQGWQTMAIQNYIHKQNNKSVHEKLWFKTREIDLNFQINYAQIICQKSLRKLKS